MSLYTHAVFHTSSQSRDPKHGNPIQLKGEIEHKNVYTKSMMLGGGGGGEGALAGGEFQGTPSSE